jgi:hypothetical protein
MPRPLFRMNNRRMNNTIEKTIIIYDSFTNNSLAINVNPFSTITQFLERYFPEISSHFNIDINNIQLIITNKYDTNKPIVLSYESRSETRLYHILGEELQMNEYCILRKI